MKTIFRIAMMLTVTSVVFSACQKEVSFEKGNTRASVGSLAAGPGGNCLGAVVSGSYFKDTTLNAAHFVDVTVQVDTAGSYTIATDNVNGYSFSATGTFTATGTQTVRLKGTGKPLAVGTNIFTVTYNGTTCEFTVTVAAGTGGSSVFTVNCTGAVLAGTYTEGTAMTAANTVTLNVNVTVTGSWSVSTSPAVNGVIFSGSGSFTATGAQTIVLTASGTPLTGGAFDFPVTVGGATCNFSCTFIALPDYFPRTTFSNWSYENDGDPNDSLLIYVVAPTFTTGGNTYKIFFYNDGTPPVDTFGYYRRAGSDYFEWIDMGTYVGLDDPLWMEYIFLKDNLTVGGTWSTAQFSGTVTPPVGAPFTATLKWDFSILQQNATVNVNGTNYANTIEVKQELKQLVSGNWVLVGYFRCFYSRDKGLIKQDLYDNANVLQSEMDVRRLVIY